MCITVLILSQAHVFFFIYFTNMGVCVTQGVLYEILYVSDRERGSDTPVLRDDITCSVSR